MKKKCYKCQELKSLDSFWKHKGTSDGLQTWCKDCKKAHNKLNGKSYYNIEYHKNYYKENKEKIAEYQRCYERNNREFINAYRRKYNTKESWLEWRRKRYKERMGKDIDFRLSYVLRARLNRALNGIVKRESVINLLGCDIEKFKSYIELQFSEGMNWDNYGYYGWHIDHIKPIASFDLTDPEQQKKCFHYTNLQPLWAEDNMSKGRKIV